MYWILVKLPSLFLGDCRRHRGHGVERYGGEHITEATSGMDWRSSKWPPAKAGVVVVREAIGVGQEAEERRNGKIELRLS